MIKNHKQKQTTQNLNISSNFVIFFPSPFYYLQAPRIKFSQVLHNIMKINKRPSNNQIHCSIISYFDIFSNFFSATKLLKKLLGLNFLIFHVSHVLHFGQQRYEDIEQPAKIDYSKFKYFGDFSNLFSIFLLSPFYYKGSQVYIFRFIMSLRSATMGIQ